jgi:hypothetical protein
MTSEEEEEEDVGGGLEEKGLHKEDGLCFGNDCEHGDSGERLLSEENDDANNSQPSFFPLVTSSTNCSPRPQLATDKHSQRYNAGLQQHDVNSPDTPPSQNGAHVTQNTDMTSIQDLNAKQEMTSQNLTSKQEVTPTLELPLMSSKEVAKHYKKCIMFLKEARNGLALKGRPYTDIPVREIGGGQSAAVESSRAQKRPGTDLRKLPLLNVLRESTQHQLTLQQHQHQQQQSVLQHCPPQFFHALHTAAGTPTIHSSQNGKTEIQQMRHFYVNPWHSHDFQLDVKGQAALRDKAQGGGVNGQEGGGRKGAVGGLAVPTKLPPAPPNTAQGPRPEVKTQTSFASYSHVWESERLSLSPRPSSSASSVAHVFRDPFGRDSWQQPRPQAPRPPAIGWW